jgi:hypothetical protein
MPKDNRWIFWLMIAAVLIITAINTLSSLP